ncbi:unnamed protein product [Nippostrongylus brasiliensis]|uniref:VHS domain-containing protein n=1 Tax=Nippostrongylus brasiliensis TaxID=27835 RepID=A0A0N4Y0J3_NIPBR|nr:unnamed protein product [Nippostrongylus brasiliensis]
MYPTAVVVVLLSTYHLCQSVEDLIRIEEKLTTSKEFYDHWMHLISLQADQLEEQSLDYPISVDPLNSCSKFPPTDADDSTDSLNPSASNALPTELSRPLATSNCILDTCDHRPNAMELPSLDKMLRVFNPALTVIQSNERDDNLVEQSRSIAHSIHQLQGYENVWKLIVIAATIQDGDASESRQTAVEVLGAVEELHKLLPHRTFIVVACHELLSRWKSHSQYNSISVWDQMETIVQKNFRRPYFTVEVLPLLRESSLTNLPEQ